MVADPTMGYVQRPGGEYAFAHPAGGDVCTFVLVRPSLWHAVVGDEPPHPRVAVDGRVELAHRLLLRTGHDSADPPNGWCTRSRRRSVRKPTGGTRTAAAAWRIGRGRPSWRTTPSRSISYGWPGRWGSHPPT
ncbi:hypothetical protein Msi02_31390 [Microbispora siamensis]|uniref:Uncharacterized protein n=1 Tax=Microbispora siamensis TaxID=564413 RepID=A0ABQ4GLN1_9ACTN|nr:hypothetical protein Msi02_31390 [Microbispora siamensis]